MEAKKVAEFTGLNRSSRNNIYHKLRERIAELCEAESPFKECEFRYNYRNQNIYLFLLKNLRKNKLN